MAIACSDLVLAGTTCCPRLVGAALIPRILAAQEEGTQAGAPSAALSAHRPPAKVSDDTGSR